MNYCINPKCHNRQNSDAVKYCPACGTALLINDRYRIIKPLRSLDLGHPTEIFEVEDWGTDEQEWGTHKVLKVLKYTDFFALGRTFVYLLTGKAPINLISDNDPEQIIWRNSTVKIENYLADFIDEMMNIKPEKRPKNTQILLKKLKLFVTPP
ncbi:4-Cys prefix domain-containing protein [Kamptonema formosum]|uniref:4-Cys prefix domain-containing protein n=1 Tax=Kamptonema formosum TaxID=331992 RepID=UPI000373F954|nr:4-Cys prefix domain-containing protein [Kamptonema formosum]